MPDPKRVAGVIEVKVNGTVYFASGSFSYNLGQPMKTEMVGHDKFHGYQELPQAGFIEGEIRAVQGLSLKDIANTTNATVTLTDATSRQILISDAFYSHEGTGSTEEGNFPVKFVGEAEELPT
jgi:hypothetical protein